MINIRPMYKKDVDEIYAIEQAAYITPWTRELFINCILVGYDCQVLEITEGIRTKIVGYIICRKQLNTCHILNICVNIDQQRKGYGQKLLNYILNNVASSQCNNVILEVRQSNIAAIHLYEKFGFKPQEIKVGYYTGKDGIEDAICFKKVI